MAQPIFTPPTGLQSFFSTKQNGVNPFILPNELHPVMNLQPFYELGLGIKQLAVSFTPTVSGEFAFGSIVVPQTKLWIPISHSTRTTGGAGDSADVFPAYGHARAPTTPIAGVSTATNQGVTGASPRQQLNTWNWTYPRIFPPGYGFGYWAAFIVLGTLITTVVTLEYFEIDA